MADLVAAGLVVADLVVADLVAAGLVVAGLVVAGLVVAGLVVAGLVVAGLVVAGLGLDMGSEGSQRVYDPLFQLPYQPPKIPLSKLREKIKRFLMWFHSFSNTYRYNIGIPDYKFS